MNKVIGFIGFLIVFGSAGGLDNATDAQLLPLCFLAVAGMGLMCVPIIEEMSK
jgi:hypothetical protein